jgi:hypothetical protein
MAKLSVGTLPVSVPAPVARAGPVLVRLQGLSAAVRHRDDGRMAPMLVLSELSHQPQGGGQRKCRFPSSRSRTAFSFKP